MIIQRSPVEDNKFLNFEVRDPTYLPNDDYRWPGVELPGDAAELPGKPTPDLPNKPREEEDPPPAAPESDSDDDYLPQPG
jgi:hypothetical protein